MSSRGRARGTGRGLLAGRGARSTPPGGPTRQPNPETLAHLGVPAEGDAENGQFDDAEAPPAADTLTTPIEGNQSNIEQETQQETSFNPSTPEISPKLNPSAPVFSPTGSKGPLSPISSTSSTLNPTTPEFSPSGLNVTASNTSHSASPNNTQPTPLTVKHHSHLNPRSGEFFPKSLPSVFVAANSPNTTLNVSAPVFVPQEDLPSTMQNGQLDEEEEDGSPGINGDGFGEEDPLSLTPKDIISKFEPPVSQENDVASESLLKAAAEMLIKSTIYPASFERWKLKLENTVSAWAPTDDSLTNLAEMLIYWGITEAGLCLSSSRICQVLNDMELLRGRFNLLLVARLQNWYRKRTTIEREQLVNFSLFFAEVYSRLRTTDQETPIRILGKAVLQLLAQLLERVDERLIIGACHILKLTGPLLHSHKEECDSRKKEGEMGLDEIVSTLERFTVDEKLPLSSKCVDIVVRVLELHARQWGHHPRPLSTSHLAPTPLNQYLFGSDVAEGESSAGAMPAGEAAFQAPVSNPDEWNEFLDDNNELIEDSDSPTTESYVMATASELEDELDAEMRKEFEFFVQDLEDHLLNMGDMDPEQFQEEQ